MNQFNLLKRCIKTVQELNQIICQLILVNLIPYNNRTYSEASLLQP
jgi:hypothetical protein